MEKITSHNTEETKKLARRLAREMLLQKNGKQAVVLGLQGDLGAGKTTFVQGFAEGLGIAEKILSPTFVVMKRFALDNERFENFYHIDCYRLKDDKDIGTLGLQEILKDGKNIIAVEWPEMIPSLLKQITVSVRFAHDANADSRVLEITKT